jgi:hypothetical protein
MESMTALPAVERARQLSSYLRFLRERDGEPDLATRTLSKRVEFFRELERNPVRPRRAIDRDAFHRNLGRTPEPGLDPRILWLLAAAKVNIGERYAVEQVLRRRPAYGTGVDETLRFIHLEEMVHTHLLLECCRTFGLEFELGVPARGLQVLMKLISGAPEPLSRPLVLCGEMIGTESFRVMWERTEVFADDPEVMARMRALVEEILTDETGHVIYNRANMGPTAMGIARGLLPVVLRGMVRPGEEIPTLAGGRDRFVQRVMSFELGGTSGFPQGLAFAAG